jgi:hypothetical protein
MPRSKSPDLVRRDVPEPGGRRGGDHVIPVGSSSAEDQEFVGGRALVVSGRVLSAAALAFVTWRVGN